MTTNPTIDGVPRELLERIREKLSQTDYTWSSGDPEDELRALLEAPAVERKVVKRYDRDSVAGHCDVEIALPEHKILHHDHGPNLAEALTRLAGRVARFHKLEAPSLAAQPQGEPVAWIKEHWSGKSADFHYKSLTDVVFKEDWKPLYAEQPAPVAVVTPERKTVLVGVLSESNTHNQGWNACLDELKRLNPSL